MISIDTEEKRQLRLRVFEEQKYKSQLAILEKVSKTRGKKFALWLADKWGWAVDYNPKDYCG